MRMVPKMASSLELILDLVVQFINALKLIFEFFGIPLPGEQ